VPLPSARAPRLLLLVVVLPLSALPLSLLLSLPSRTTSSP
jgi:hypothetical protein